jgi:hypothetical protein
MTLMLFSGAWGKMISKKTLKPKISWHVPLYVISFFHIINNCPCEKDDSILYLFYYIIRRVCNEPMTTPVLGRKPRKETLSYVLPESLFTSVSIGRQGPPLSVSLLPSLHHYTTCLPGSERGAGRGVAFSLPSRSECAPPPVTTRLRVRGWGVPIPTTGEKV